MEQLQLIGRSNEWAVLLSCLSRVRSGDGAAVLVRGRMGYGKTYLLQRLVEESRKQGVLVAACSLRIRNRTTPYSLWIRIIEDLLVSLERSPDCEDPVSWVFGGNAAALGHIVPHLTSGSEKSVSSAALRSGISHEILRVIARVARRKPLLLVFDNLQFADESSQSVFADICSSLRWQQNLMLCVTLREPREDAGPHLAEALSGMLHELQAVQLILPPFTREDISEYFTHCGADPGDALIEEVYRTTEGNPLFVSQFGSLGSGGCRDLTDELSPEVTRTVEQRILEYFQLRMHELNEATCRVLCASAVLGGEFSSSEIAVAVGDCIRDETLMDAVRQALSYSFFDTIENDREAPALYRFHHELVRRAVVRASDRAMLQAAHARMAVYLLGSDGDSQEPEDSTLQGHSLSKGRRMARIAEHQLLSGCAETMPEGVERMLAAGEAFLVGGAWEDAEAVFLRLQSDHSSVLTSADRARLDYGIGKVRLFDGRKPESFPFLLSALNVFAAAGDMAQLMSIALQPVFFAPGHGAFLTVFQRAAEVLNAETPHRLRVSAYEAAAVALIKGQYEYSLRALSGQGGPGALEEIDETDGMRARAFVTYLYVRLSRFGDARSALNDILPRIPRKPDAVTESLVWSCEYEMSRLTGDHNGSLEFLRKRHAADEFVGDRSLLADSALKLGRVAMNEGDWSAARRYMSRALELVPAYPLALSNMVTLERVLGNESAADELLERLLEEALNHESGPHTVLIAGASALTTTAIFSDDNESSKLRGARLLDAARLVRRARGGLFDHPFIAVRRLVLSAVIAYYLRDSRGSERVLTDLAHTKRYNLIHPGHIERARGLLHYLRGSRSRGEECLRNALSLFRAGGDLPQRVLVESEIASEALIAGSTNAALHDTETAIADALATCEYYGMAGLSDRLQRILALGSAARSDDAVLRRLTAREREVLALLAAGFSDKEIAGCLQISTYTASNHVRHILSKCECTSRTQVVARFGSYRGRSGAGLQHNIDL